MWILDVFDSRVSLIDAIEMSFSLSSWMSSCLFPRIPLMLMCKKFVKVIMKM